MYFVSILWQCISVNATYWAFQTIQTKVLRGFNESRKQDLLLYEVSQNITSHNWKTKRESPVCRDTRVIPYTSCGAEWKEKPRGCARNWQGQMRLSWGEACTLHPLPYPSSNPLQDDTFHVASQFSSTPGGRVRYQCPGPQGATKSQACWRKLLKLITVSLGFLNISWKEAASLF